MRERRGSQKDTPPFDMQACLPSAKLHCLPSPQPLQLVLQPNPLNLGQSKRLPVRITSPVLLKDS